MKELYIPATIDNFPKAIGFLDEYLETNDCPMGVQISLDVAVEEMYVNVAHYAYPNENADGKGMVRIQLEMLEDNNGVKVTLIDQGVKYNPLEKPDPDVTLSAEERQIGGLGIYMVKKSMDQVDYQHDGSSNIFSMIKKFS